MTVDAAAAVKLPARADVEGQFAERAFTDFTACSKREQEKKPKLLAAKAEDRGCLHAPPPVRWRAERDQKWRVEERI